MYHTESEWGSYILHPGSKAQQLEESEIPFTILSKLEAHSKGILTVPEFANEWKEQPSSFTNRYSLGLSLDTYYAASEAFGLQNWEESYKKHGIKITARNHTHHFLSRITNEDSQIVFFVPPHLYSHSVGEITRLELEWFAQNIGQASNAYFVFGLYYLYSLDKDRTKVFFERFRFLDERMKIMTESLLGNK